MRKLSLVLLASAVLFVCAVPAFAGSANEIVLGGSANAPIKFTGTGSGGTGGLGTHNFSVSFNVMNLGATGYGTLSSNGFYSILNNGASVYGMSSSCAGGSCTFMLGQSAPLAFSYGTTLNGTDLLTGYLTLVDLIQTGTNGVFNDQLVINFMVTGGSLQSQFANNNGMVQLTVKFITSQSLSTITTFNTGTHALMAKVVSGAVFPVPEPGSLTLLGTSLLGFAFLCKKKLFA